MLPATRTRWGCFSRAAARAQSPTRSGRCSSSSARSSAATLRWSATERQFFGGAGSGSHNLHSPALCGSLALRFIKDLLPQPQVLGGGFHVFVRANVFQGTLQRHLQRRVELNALAVTLGTHVGQFFGLARIDR